MAESAYLDELQALLDEQVRALRAERRSIPHDEEAPKPRGRRMVFPAMARRAPYVPPTPEQEARKARVALQRRVKFLNELRTRLTDDPDIVRLVDGVIGNHVQEAERRQEERLHAALREQAARYEGLMEQQKAELASGEQRQNRRAVAVTAVSCAVSLVVGWLLSAVSPASALAHILVR